MVAAARPVGIEFRRLHAVFLQIFSRRAVLFDGTRRRNVIGGYTVPEDGEYARILDVRYRDGLRWHPIEVGRETDVSRIRLPGIGVAFGNLQRLPVLVSRIDFAVCLAEHF